MQLLSASTGSSNDVPEVAFDSLVSSPRFTAATLESFRIHSAPSMQRAALRASWLFNQDDIQVQPSDHLLALDFCESTFDAEGR